MLIMRFLAIAVCIIMMLGLTDASQYLFGTKVTSLDSDFGAPLRLYSPPNPAPPSFTLGYWETGVVLGYDDTDVVYLHQGFVPGAVNANDIRLTPFGYIAAGSKVTPQDNDIGMGLILFPGVPFPSALIAWVNSHGGPGHDLDDPVYIHPRMVGEGVFGAGITPTATNDVRLSEVSGLPPGSKVGNLDPDLPNVFALSSPPTPNPIAGAALFGAIVPPARVKYVDINGNGRYDYPDDVYLITATPPATSVSVNDVRLTAPA